MRRVTLLSWLAALALLACNEVAPAPSGYIFPVHNVDSGGPTGLLQGVIVEDDGCIFVRGARGIDYLVQWPDTLRLVLGASGSPEIVDDNGVVARVGDRVEIVGGESDVGLSTDVKQRCPGQPYFGVEVRAQQGA